VRNSTLFSASFALLAFVSLAGCGGRSGLEVPDWELDGGSLPTSDTDPLADSPVPTDDAGVCVPQCQTDLECQLSCGALPAGQVNCCDRRSAICYKFEATECPRGGRNDGGPVWPY
jgi:predicted small lipoprotein YifL